MVRPKNDIKNFLTKSYELVLVLANSNAGLERFLCRVCDLQILGSSL